MTRRHMSRCRTILALLPFLLAGLAWTRVAAQEAVVHAVLFYSPTCPHCHRVITEDLPPLAKKYGQQLVVAGVDVSTPEGGTLFKATARQFDLKPPRYGVPTLVVGSDVMVGDREIPERFPSLVERGLAAGGVDWPQVPALRKALAAQGLLKTSPASSASGAAGDSAVAVTAGRAPGPPRTEPAGEPAGSARATGAEAAPTGKHAAPVGTTKPPPEEPAASAVPVGATKPPPASDTEKAITTNLAAAPPPPGPLALFRRDPLGNGAAVVVLLGLLGAILVSLVAAARGKPLPPRIPSWFLPLLATVGMAVASYLAFVEVTGHAAVCGPVGDCNTVQQSPYALLFGLVPIGILGQLGYLTIFGIWVFGVLGPPRLAPVTWSVLWGMALVGTGFSAYLTYLEPFVIGATCVWCLASSVVMALILLLSTPQAIPGGRSGGLS